MSGDSRAPQLVEEFRFHADVDVVMVGPGPFGQRAVATITGGELSGGRLKGSLVGAGADWDCSGQTGSSELTSGQPFEPSTMPTSTSSTPDYSR